LANSSSRLSSAWISPILDFAVSVLSLIALASHLDPQFRLDLANQAYTYLNAKLDDSNKLQIHFSRDPRQS